MFLYIYKDYSLYLYSEKIICNSLCNTIYVTDFKGWTINPVFPITIKWDDLYPVFFLFLEWVLFILLCLYIIEKIVNGFQGEF